MEREALQALIAVDANALTQDARAARDEREVRRIQQRNDIDSAAKATLVLARRGLGAYRENLEQIETACRVTGVLYGLRISSPGTSRMIGKSLTATTGCYCRRTSNICLTAAIFRSPMPVACWSQSI
jgi:hypothetical protein